MDIKGCSSIPIALFDWITFLAQSLPIRSVPTFIELLVGAMLTQSGFVVQVGLVIDLERHWTTYFKWLQHGRWSWLALARQVARLVTKWFPYETCSVTIQRPLWAIFTAGGATGQEAVIKSGHFLWNRSLSAWVAQTLFLRQVEMKLRMRQKMAAPSWERKQPEIF